MTTTIIKHILDYAMQQVCEEFNVSTWVIRGSSRRECHYIPRWTYYYILKETVGMSYISTGRLVGKDHSTIQYAVTMLKKRRTKNKLLDVRVHYLLEDVKSEISKVFLNYSKIRGGENEIS